MATLNLGLSSFSDLKASSVIGYKGTEYKGYKASDFEGSGATKVATVGAVEDVTNGLTLTFEDVSGAAAVTGFVDTTEKRNWKLDFSGKDITEGITLGEGNDSVTVAGASEKNILLGNGNNMFTATGTVKDITISAEDGSDKFVLAGLDGAKVNTGAGKDTVVLGNNKSATIDLGDGADELSFADTSAAMESDVVVTLGDGKDTVDATKLTGGTVTLADYNIAEDAIKGDNAFDAANYASDGTFAVGSSAGRLKVNAENGFYAINGDKAGYVAWAKEDATSIDLSSFNKAVKIVGSQNEKADTLMGGTKVDTIVAGAGDMVYGGAGNDSIVLVGTGSDSVTYVGLAAAGGKDTVYGGDKNDVVYLFENGIGEGVKLSKDSTGNHLVVTQGSASLTLDGAVNGGTETHVKIMDKTATTYDVDFVSGKAVVSSADSISGIYYGDSANKANEIDFNAVDESLVVDLGNTGIFQNTNNAVYVGNFASVTGGKAETILMGNADASETLIAGTGNTTLWGGGKKADVLVGNATKDDNHVTYFYTAGDGKDTVQGFVAGNADDNADVLYLSNVALGGISRDSKTLTISTTESTDKLTVSLAAGATADSVIQYTTDGQTVNQVKIGVSSKSNAWTYNEDVQAYIGGKNNSLSVSSDVDNANIWLDGSKGVSYENVTKVDASASSNTVLIAGNGSVNETITGGTGESSLWGGAGSSNDTLKGSYGGTTSYFFGSGDGNDVITGTGSDDKVVLYNVALSDIKALDNSTSTMKITLNDGSTLSVKGMSTASVNTFQLGDGSTWNYDYGTKSWSQK